MLLLHAINFNKSKFTKEETLETLRDLKQYPIANRDTDNFYMYRINPVNSDLKNFYTTSLADGLINFVYQY